jgi:hypothetical protein
MSTRAGTAWAQFTRDIPVSNRRLRRYSGSHCIHYIYMSEDTARL